MFNNLLDLIPSYQGGDDSRCFDCNNGSYMLRVTGTTKQEYDNYLASLAKAGFSLHDSNCIRDNYHATYISSNILVQAYFTNHDGITRIIADLNTTLYTRKQDVTYKKLCDTTLYQMELDYRNVDCGMCYVTQCADGSFFIIDSAHMNSVNDHKRLYDLLRRLTPEGEKIIISGWFFSHAHQDHVAMFMNFLEADFKDYQIECLYYNFPSLNVLGSEHWGDDDKQTMRDFDELLEKHKDIPRIKLHTGQRFNIRNLEFDVLATHEDIYPSHLNDFNNSSTIIMMRAEGSKTLFLGDSNVAECSILVSRYGAYLKSDIVQVAHHGYNAANVGIYFFADAKVALYPTRKSNFEQDQVTESNRKVKELSKEMFVAGLGTVGLKLPYVLGTAVVFEKEVI